MNIIELIREELQKKSLDKLEDMCEEWLGYKYMNNPWETKEVFEERKSIAIPLIIEEKLNRYEQEYS